VKNDSKSDKLFREWLVDAELIDKAETKLDPIFELGLSLAWSELSTRKVITGFAPVSENFAVV
jgi:hypothetical protein